MTDSTKATEGDTPRTVAGILIRRFTKTNALPTREGSLGRWERFVREVEQQLR